MNNESNYGLLMNQNAKLHRNYFNEMAKLLGFKVIVKNPTRTSKEYSMDGELMANYEDGVVVYGIFQAHIDQRTSKKLGWNAEQDEEMSIIHLPYDLDGLQIGSLVIVPSAIDNAKGRVFRVHRMSTIMIYPASVACELAVEWEDELPKSAVHDFHQTNFNLLRSEDGRVHTHDKD